MVGMVGGDPNPALVVYHVYRPDTLHHHRYGLLALDANASVRILYHAMKHVAAVFVAGCAAAIAGCSNPPSGSCAPGTYSIVPVPVFTMLDPSAGATAVPDGITGLTFSGVPENGAKIILTANGQTVATISTLTAVPVPGNPEYSAALPIALRPATTYTVIYRFTLQKPPGDTCSQAAASLQLGSFTTQ